MPPETPLRCVRLGLAAGVVAVPVDSVHKVVTYRRTAPLPLSRGWAAGLARVDDAILACVRMDPAAPREAADTEARGVWLKGPGGRACVVEIDRVLGFADRVAEPLAPSVWVPCPRDWLLGVDPSTEVVLNANAVLDAVAGRRP